MLEALEIFDWLANAFAGWRYLFSSSFRQRTNKRWKVEGRGKALIEVLFGGFGILLTLLLLWLLIDVLQS